jgi:hypothetical protein
MKRLPAPRWQTPLPGGVVGSWGPDVAAWALAELGIVLDRWQKRALNRALAYDARGLLVHRHYLVSAGRQNGKTVLVRALIGWALTGRATPAWSTILGLAHDKKQARVPYTAVLADLAPIKRRFPHEGLALTRYLGIRSDLYGRHREYDVASREARDAIRTMSVDLGLFDEIRTQRTYDTWAALEPTTRARPDPLIFAISSAGDDRSILLRDWWERGVRIIDGAEPADGFGMTWYAADDDQEPDDPRAIMAANPAVMEGRVPIGPVAASIRSLTTPTYRSETLNLWSEGADEWLPPGTWPRTVGRQPHQAMRIVLGVEAVPTWRRATITVALVTDAGAWVGVAGELDSSRTTSSSIAPATLVAELGRLAGEWRAQEVAYSGAAAAAPHVEAWAKAAGVTAIPLGPRQIRAASALFRSELIGGRLTHGDDPLLAQQVRVARPSASLEGGDWYFSIRESLGEIDALRAAAWAAWQAIAPEEPAIVPAIH